MAVNDERLTILEVIKILTSVDNSTEFAWSIPLLGVANFNPLLPL